jgi:hypothetical protein
MRIRNWLAVVLLAGLCAASVPAHANAAIWPFSLFAKKAPANPRGKLAKAKKGKLNKAGNGAGTKAVKPTH